ncbi:hypothetical protein ACJD0Z_05510 [Flavobacteriaceae bacterium M23B6Z8]
MSILLLLQSSNIHFIDLTRVDEFIAHAQFHKDQYGDTIMVFISKHYGDLKKDHSQLHQEEKSDHEQLPFEHNCQQVATTSAFVLNNFQTSLKITFFKVTQEANFYYQAASSSLHSSGILQPPRFS